MQVERGVYSAVHKAASSLVTGHSPQNRKMSMGNCCTEWSPEVILYGSRQSGGFVNSAVNAPYGYHTDVTTYIYPCTRLDPKSWPWGYVPHRKKHGISHGPGWKRDQIHDPGAMNFKTLRVQLSAIYDTEAPQYPVCR